MRLAITDAQAGERLDAVLGEAVGSRSRAQRLIDDGLVLVDGAAKPKRHRVAAGEVVEVSGPEPVVAAPAEQPAPYEVAYADDALLVIDKPAGVVVHPAPGHPTGTLSQALGDVGIVHRLDRDTSGLLVVARNDDTTSTRSPLTGCANASRVACRNWRSSPSSPAVPYSGSPTTG